MRAATSPTELRQSDDRALSRRLSGDRPRGLLRSAAILAAQRNCKILGIFTRLWRRDGKPGYLVHIPRLWRLIEADLRDPALGAIARWLDRHLPPTARRVPDLQGGCMIAPPRRAMVLAAGLGTRLRPVTDTVPKPLVEINGRTLLDHAIDRLALAGVERVVVNTHYQAAMVAEHLAARAPSADRDFRENPNCSTPAVASRRLCRCSAKPFLSSTATCSGSTARIRRCCAWPRAFDPERMDAVLLLQRTVECGRLRGQRRLFARPGRDARAAAASAKSRPISSPASSCCTAACSTALTDRVFSLVRLFDRAEEAGRLRAIVHDGEWYHIGTPAGLAATRERLSPTASSASHRGRERPVQPQALYDRARPAVSGDAGRGAARDRRR